MHCCTAACRPVTHLLEDGADDHQTFSHAVASQRMGEAGTGPEGLSEPFWLNCQHKGRQKGRLLVQVQFIHQVRVRPLKILVVTWNMGNAAANASFSMCFPDSETCAPYRSALLSCKPSQTAWMGISSKALLCCHHGTVSSVPCSAPLVCGSRTAGIRTSGSYACCPG
jgi:hypothetical protein